MKEYDDWLNNPDKIAFEKLNLTRDGEPMAIPTIKTELYEELAMEFFKPDHRHHEQLDSGLLEEAEEVFYAQTTDAKLDELSDVLWYITAMAVQEGSSLKSLMLRNLNKLERRAMFGKGNE